MKKLRKAGIPRLIVTFPFTDFNERNPLKVYVSEKIWRAHCVIV